MLTDKQKQLLENYIESIKVPRSDLLWSKITNRIDQEERADFYLGKRRVENSSSSLADFFSSLFHRRFPVFAAVGAATCAFVLGILFRQNIFSSEAPAIAVTQQVASNISNDNNVHSLPRQVHQVANSVGRTTPVEVDWIRSDGRVRIIDNSGIIWVRRMENKQ